jgi:hypothetical protein
MHLIAPTRLLVLAALFHIITALGINCRGACLPSVSVARPLTTAIEGIDPGRWFANGEQIACARDAVSGRNYAYCAFLQNTGGAWGSRILELAHHLQAHGCKGCGSVPYFYPEDNDVSHGELTYNHVIKPCSKRDGLCYVTTASSAVGGVNMSMCIVPTPKLSLLTALQLCCLSCRSFGSPCWHIGGSELGYLVLEMHTTVRTHLLISFSGKDISYIVQMIWISELCPQAQNARCRTLTVQKVAPDELMMARAA